MAKYIKRPVEIEAFQLNSRGFVGEDWFWDAVDRNEIITHSFGKHYQEDAWCEIKTLEGTMIARTGDYIIRGVKDEIYPCKADIFEATYTKNPVYCVPVICCKDCIHYMNDTAYCQKHDKGYCCLDDAIKQKNHYCGYAELKKEEHNG